MYCSLSEGQALLFFYHLKPLSIYVGDSQDVLGFYPALIALVSGLSHFALSTYRQSGCISFFLATVTNLVL